MAKLNSHSSSSESRNNDGQVGETRIAWPRRVEVVSSSQFGLLADRIPALVSYVDTTETYLFVNKSYEEWFGKPRNEIIGSKVKEIWGASAYRLLKPKIDQALAGEGDTFEKCISHKAGGKRTVNISLSSDIDQSGNVRGFYAFLTDITEIKRSEELLNSYRDRITTITESFADYAIISMDLEGRIDTWNTGAQAIFGYTAEEIVGELGDILFTPEDIANGIPQKEMRDARKHGRAIDERWHIRNDRTRFFASGVMSPLFVGEKLTGYAKIATDLTDKRRNAEELQQAYDEMEYRVAERTRALNEANEKLREENEKKAISEQARIELLQRLISSQEDERKRIARDIHDQLGQRVTALRLKLETLESISNPNKEVSTIAEGLRQIAETLDDEVSFLARELRPTDLDTFGLIDSIGNFVREWSKNYEIAAEFHVMGMKRVSLDKDTETHLYRITQECLNNIIKHAEATQVNILIERADQRVVLVIEDNGKGFDVSTASQVRPDGQGLGLLGIAERAAMMGGEVQFESEAGAGTTVLIKVPIKRALRRRRSNEQ